MMMWPLPDDGSFSGSWRRPSATDDPDVRLTYQVADRLVNDERIRHQQVTVEVQNRVVLLSGDVDTASTRQAVTDAARSVSGVVDVCDGLRVQESGGIGTSHDQQFRVLVAALRAEDPSWGEQPTRPRRRSAVALWAIAATLVWATLSVLMVRFGWAGVAVSCVAIGLALTVLRWRSTSRRAAKTSPER